MKNEVNKIAKDTNYFLKKFINNQNSSHLINAMKYGLFPGGKKIRSKILIDFGSLFSIRYKTLIQIGAAVECIHAYSLIHDDLPCMDNDKIRRGKASTHIKYGESTAVLAGNSLLTMAFEILSNKNLDLSEKTKVNLIKKLSECSGHLGIAGGQYLDLDYEKKKGISDLKMEERLKSFDQNVNKNNQLIISDGFTNSLKNKDIEFNLIHSLKDFEVSNEELKNFLSLGKSEIRNDLLMRLFIYRYQANSLQTFSEISNYSNDIRGKIINTSPFRAQIQIMPEDEKQKLIKLFENIEVDKKLTSDLIIMNKTDKFYNFTINNKKYNQVYTGKVYDIFRID